MDKRLLSNDIFESKKGVRGEGTTAHPMAVSILKSTLWWAAKGDDGVNTGYLIGDKAGINNGIRLTGMG